MQNTTATIGFASDSTVQLRMELGDVVNGVQQPAAAIPQHDFENEAGYIFKDGEILGRISGNRDYFMPLDQYLASPLDPLFDLSNPFSNDAAAAVDDLSMWSVTVNGVAVPLTGFSRKANILDTAETGWFSFEFRTCSSNSPTRFRTARRSKCHSTMPPSSRLSGHTAPTRSRKRSTSI